MHDDDFTRLHVDAILCVITACLSVCLAVRGDIVIAAAFCVASAFGLAAALVASRWR